MIARDMKPYGLYEKGQIGESPTGRPIYGWNKIGIIDVAVAFKSQYVDNKDLNYRLTSLSGITISDKPLEGMCLVESDVVLLDGTYLLDGSIDLSGINYKETLDKIQGFKIVSSNNYTRRVQLILEEVDFYVGGTD